MSPKVLSLLLVAPAMLVGSAARAQTSDKSPDTKDQPPPAAPAAAEAPKEPPPPPVEPPPEPKAEAKPEAPAEVNPWFDRPPFEMKSGKWKLQVYGFAEADIMNDSTRSFQDGMNSNVIVPDNTQAGQNGRTQMTIRNTRVGFKGTSPEFAGIKSTGVVEGDFFGYDPNSVAGNTPQTSPGAAGAPSEAGFFNNPTWRIRHAYLRLDADSGTNLLIGQTYHVLGWQNYFFQCSLAFLGLPSELFGRTQMVRLGQTIKGDAVNFDIQLAGVRPVQRDSAIPDGEAGLRLQINKWKGINTPGNGGTAAFPAAIGVSGMVRRFKLDQAGLAPGATPGPQSTDTGYAVAVDALIPVIPAADSTDRGNALTLVGEYTIGTGDADEFTGMTAGASNRVFNNIAPDIDNGLVTYDTIGTLHTIPWQTFVVGLQYYIPPTGRAILSFNYNEADSDKIDQLYPKNPKVFKKSQYADASLFFDVTPAARLGAGYQYLKQTFTDSSTAQNHRWEILALYFF